MAEYAGLPAAGGVEGTKFSLTRAERSLLQWAVLDHEGQVLVQEMWEPMPTEADLGALYVSLESMGDTDLIARFADVVNGCVPSDYLLFIYDVCRPEVRWLLPRMPYMDRELARRREGFDMECASVERCARLLHEAGVADLLMSGCVEPSERASRMLIGVMAGDGHVGDDVVAALGEMWLGLVSAVDPVNRDTAYYSLDVALALAAALPLSIGRDDVGHAYPDARQFLFERG